MASVRISVLHCGTTSLDYELIATAHPDRLLKRSRQAGERYWCPQPIYCYIIEHPDGRILFDTAVSPRWREEWKHPFYPDAMAYEAAEEEYFQARLRRHGLSIDDFKYVVLSHLHTDHAGNVRLFKDTGATILVHEDELRGAVLRKGGLLRDDDITLWGVTSPQGFTRRDWGFLVPERATTVYGDIEIAKGVWLISLPGHTWGTMGMAVRLAHSGWVLMPSDALYHHTNYGDPFVSGILNHHQERWAQSALKIRKLAETYDMTILPGHDDTSIVRPRDRPASTHRSRRYTSERAGRPGPHLPRGIARGASDPRSGWAMFFETHLTNEQIEGYTRAGFWKNRVLHDYFLEHVRRTPDKTALIDRKGRCSYAELLEIADRVALGLLELGVRPRDVVSVQLPNWNEYVILLLAIERVGGVMNPLTPILRHRELLAMLRIARSKVYAVPQQFRGFDFARMALDLQAEVPGLEGLIIVGPTAPAGGVSWEELAGAPWEARIDRRILECLRPDPNDIAELAFTSGTTGVPKGVLHTHNTAIATVGSTIARQGFGPETVNAVASPVGHNMGYFYGVRLALQAGGTAVLQDIWDPAATVRLIERHQATLMAGATTFLIDLLRVPDLDPHDLRSLKVFICGGASIPPAIAREAIDRLGVRLTPVFGMTEQGHSTSTGPDDPIEKVISTDGSPQPEMEVKIVDAQGRRLPPRQEGRLMFRGALNFVGYIQGRAFTAPYFDDEDFFDTGDLAYLDEDGYIRITGRTKDIIIRGGENLPVKDIEDILFGHPKVLEVAVVAMPDPRLGERACACIRLKPGAAPLTMEELRAFLAKYKVTKYFWPEAIERYDDFPRTASGKVQKFKLREDIARKLHEGKILLG